MGEPDGGALYSQFPWLRDTLICDGLLPWSKPFLPPGASLSEQLSRLRTSGFSHVSLTLAAGQDTALEALQNLGSIAAELRSFGTEVTGTSAQIRAAHAAGRFSVSFHFQTSTPFASSLDLVDAFFAAGVTRAILAYNDANVFADGCHEPRNAGLSVRGRALVRRMDAVGMRIDLTHCGQKTVSDVLELETRLTPMFSHSNAAALYPHERNISDQQIRLAAEAGGYFGVNGVGFFLGAEDNDIPREMARHAAHIAGLAGADKIGLGTDFMFLEGSDYGFFHNQRDTWPRGYPEPPWSFFQPEQLPALVAALEVEGFTKDQIRGLLGENYLRFLAESSTELWSE